MSKASKASQVEHSVDTRLAADGGNTEPNALNLQCTKEAGVRCKLLAHRRELNKVLLGAGLEVREDRRGLSRGDVLIAVVQSSTCSSGEDSRKAKALDLVERLLGQHHCITAMEFNHNVMIRLSLLPAVKCHRSLKSVTVCGIFITPAEAAFMFEVINSLSELQNLVFNVDNFENKTGEKVGFFGTSYLLGKDYLTTLDVADVMMPDIEASRLIQVLIQSKSITDLAVGECVFNHRDEDSNALFPRYLAQEKCMLRKLKLKSDIFSGSWSLLVELIDVFCKMKVLEELIADIVMEDASFVYTVALFAEVITQSATLRSLRLPTTHCQCEAALWFPSALSPHPEAAQCMKPWLAALPMPNSPLKKLGIDLRGFGEAECHDFFHAIADNNSLVSVVVHSLPIIDGLDRVCTTIRNRGLKDRVVIMGHYTHLTTKQLQECQQISSASIGHSYVMRNEYFRTQLVISAFGVVAGCAHVTSLQVDCYNFDRNDFSALAACIRGPSALIDVDIDLSDVRDYLTPQEQRDVQCELVSALAANLNLVRVCVRGAQLSDYDFAVLADGANKSISITDFTATPGCTSTAMPDAMDRREPRCRFFMIESFTGASDANDIALADIMQATRRNASALSAAAQFVLGEQDTFEGADAIELMHGHPRLLGMVMDGADVTKAKAQKMISSTLLRVRHCSLDEFMAMAGVVKDRVACLRHPDAKRQLADIDHDSWLHIRSYLKIVDVLHI